MEYTPTTIWQELEAGERETNLRATVPDELRMRFVGKSWQTITPEAARNDDTTPLSERDATGFVYEFLSWYGPQLVYSNPRVSLVARSMPLDDRLFETVKMVSAAVNQWIVSTRYIELMDALWQDYLLNFCAVSIAEKPTGVGYDATGDGRNWPEVRRSSYRNIWRDPLALTYEECLWWAERTVVDRDTLIKHAKNDEAGGWNVEMLEELPKGDVSRSYRPAGSTDSALERNEIELVEAWFPGYSLDEKKYTAKKGYYGTLFTLAMTRGAQSPEGSSGGGATVFARPPRPFRGTRGGAFETQGAYRVSDSPFTLSPLVAIDSQRDENAIQVGAALRRMRRRKRLVVSTADDPEFRRQVESGEEGSLVTLREAGNRDVRELVQQVEVEGLSTQDLECVQFSSDLLRRVAGMGETQAGYAAGRATATEVATASLNSNVRAERIKERWRAFHERVLYAVACYIATSGEVEITVNADVLRASGVAVPEGTTGIRFKGGDLSWEDMQRLALEVDVTTLERATESQAQQRQVQAHTLVLDAMPHMQMNPDPVWWERHFEKIGDALNVPHLGQHVGQLVAGIRAQMQEQLALQLGLAAQGVQGGQSGAGASARPNISVGFNGKGSSGQRTSAASPAFGSRNGTGPGTPPTQGKALGGLTNAGNGSPAARGGRA